MKNLDAELDKWFSLYTRVRFADYRGYVHCYTCPTLLPWRAIQCGHWQRRGHGLTRWLKDNARPQCPHCNMDLNGRPDVFEEELRQELGDQRVELIARMARETDEREDRQKENLLAYFKMECKTLGAVE